MSTEYGIVVTGNDATGDFIISDSATSLVPFIVANIGKGTSAPLPPNKEDFLLYVNAKGTYPSQITNTTITATNVTRDTTTNTAYFWSASAVYIINSKKGTTTVSPRWFSQSAYYIVLARTDTLDLPAGDNYGILLQDANANEVFNSSKIYVNDSWRILGQFEFTDSFGTLNTFQKQTITTDSNVFIDMSPFTYDTTNATTVPGAANTGICGPYFDTNQIDHALNVSFNGVGTYYGAYTYGKLLYNNANPADALNALPAGFTVPY